MDMNTPKNVPDAPSPDEKLFETGLSVVLIEPEIAPNAGNISRLCYASNLTLHIVGKPGFEITSDKHFRRAAVDYWDKVEIISHENFEAFTEFARKKSTVPPRFIMATKRGKCLYYDFQYEKGDYLVFGPESRGIPKDILKQYEDTCVRIPLNSKVRSLNLSTSCGIIVHNAIHSVNKKNGLA